jgi:hypothetical protein
MRHDLRRLSGVAVAVLLLASCYYGYVILFGGGLTAPRPEDQLSDWGESLGGGALGLFVALYGRTAIRLLLTANSSRPFSQLGQSIGPDGWEKSGTSSTAIMSMPELSP